MARSNRSVLSSADVVVMCLPQNRAVWENAFSNHASIHRKTFYVLGNYEEDSELSAERLSRDYGVSMERIGTIPHCAYINDAVSRGAIVSSMMNCFQGDQTGTEKLKESLDSIATGLFKRMHDMGKDQGYDTANKTRYKTFVADGGVSYYGSYNRRAQIGISQGKCL